MGQPKENLIVAKKRGRPKNSTLSKAVASEELAVSRIRTGAIGSSMMALISKQVDAMKPFELRWPVLISTVECMKQDSTVSTALDVIYILIEKAFANWKIISNPASDDSKEASDFIEYCFKNIPDQSLRKIARDLATINEYGFSVSEKVFTKVKTGKYKDKFKIGRVGFRPQASLDRQQPFVFDNTGSVISAVRQVPLQNNVMYSAYNYIGVNVNATLLTNFEPTDIPRNKLLICTLGSMDSNTMGVSPLVGCYKDYKEKLLIENLEVIGVTKDLAGVIELRVPSQVLRRADLDPNSVEAAMISDLMRDAANAHAGDQTFFMLPSDTNTNGVAQFAMNLKGIDGRGKSFNTQELIKARKKSILDRFGAGVIDLGDGGGSYNLSQAKNGMLYNFVNRTVNIILEVLNYDLIPQLLALNNYKLSQEDMPYIETTDVADIDMESYSKMVQRLTSVGLIPKTPDMVNEILAKAGFDYRIADDLTQDELEAILSPNTSRSGDGMEVGRTGNGTATTVSGIDSSSLNLENK